MVESFDETNRELAAVLIEQAICQAICYNNREALEWLHIKIEPNNDEISTPAPLTYVWACIQVGIDWKWLMDTVKAALSLTKQKPVLRLVQSCERVKIKE